VPARRPACRILLARLPGFACPPAGFFLRRFGIAALLRRRFMGVPTTEEILPSLVRP